MSIKLRRPLSSGQKTASLAVLYFVQGLPYGFQDKLVPLVLIERGHSASSVALTRLLLLPWLGKPLLAPLIETVIAFSLYLPSSYISTLPHVDKNDVCEYAKTFVWVGSAFCGHETHTETEKD